MSCQRISPSCLEGYDIVCSGAGTLERNEYGKKNNIPEPVLSNCVKGDGLCWWVRPVGFSFSLTLPVSKIKKFWRKD